MKGLYSVLNYILLKSDTLCLLELMTSKLDCHILNSCNPDYIGHGVSPYDASSGLLVGRPYGGVFFMWKNALDECVTIVHCDYGWMCSIKLSSVNKDKFECKM